MKNRRTVVFAAAILLVCVIYFLLPTSKPTLYGDYIVSGELEVQAGFNEDCSEVLYTVINRSDHHIDYDFAVLECMTDDGWQEVLTRSFQRQSEIGRTAEQAFFPAGETTQGSIPLVDLRHKNTTQYRIVFPLTDTEQIASVQF